MTNLDIENPGSDAYELAAAMAGIVPLTRSRKLVCVGDSITGQGGLVSGNPNIQSRAWWQWANAMLGLPFETPINEGVSGETAAEILARIDSILAHRAGFYIYQSGTNDLQAGRSAAEIIADQLATLRAMTATGAIVAFLSTHYTSSAATAPAEYATLLDWQRLVAPTLPGVVVVDAARIVMDQSSGLSSAQFLADAVHLTAHSAARLGKAVAATLAPFAPSPRPWLQIRDRRNYVHSSPIMAGSNSTGSNGTYFETGITGVGSDGIWVNRIAAGAAVMSKVATTLTEFDTISKLRGTTTLGSDNDGFAIRFGTSPVSNQTQFNLAWPASTAVIVSRRRRPTVPNGFTYKCVGAGTTDGTEPTWPTDEGATVLDGTVTWLCQKMPEEGDIFQAFVDLEISGVAADKWVVPTVSVNAADSGGNSLGSVFGMLYNSGTDGAAPDGLNGRLTLASAPLVIGSLGANVFRDLTASLQVIGEAGANPVVDVKRCEIVRLSD